MGVARGSGIHQLADLKGKRVGLFRGTAAELSFVNALDSQGLKASDIKIINLDFAAASAALAAGQIDATWGGSNILSLRDKGLAEIPLSSRDLQGAGQLSGFLLVDEKFAQGNEDILRRLVKVQREAAAWGSAEKTRTPLFNYWRPNPVTRKTYYAPNGIPYRHYRSDCLPKWDSDYVAKLKRAVKLAHEVRLIRQPFDVDQWLDDSYLNAIR